MQRFTKKNTFALSQLIDRTAGDVEALNEILSSFSCEQDRDIRNFLLNRAITFENLSKSKTYLIVDENQMNLPDFKLIDNGFNKISQIPDEDCEMVQLMRKI